MSYLQAAVRRIGDVAIIDLSGKINIGEGEVALREHVDDLLEGRRNKILLNMARVTSMDSAGVGELAACFKRVKTARGALKLLSPTESVDNLLRLTKLRDVFEVYHDEATALASF